MKLKKWAGAVIVLSMMMFMSIAVHAESYDTYGWLYVGEFDILNYDYKDQLPAGVTYDISTNTLTLNNCTYQLKNDEINFVRYSGSEDLNIVLKGTNKIIGTVDAEYNTFSFEAIYSSGANLNFSGGGSLEIQKFQDIASADLDDGTGSVNFNNVTITSSGARIYQLYSNVNIINSKITLNRKDGSDDFVGIHSDNNIYIKGSVVDITNFENPLICKNYNLDGEYIYAGVNSLQYGISADTFFTDNMFDSNYYFSRESYVGKRVLITNVKQNLGYRYTVKALDGANGYISKITDYGVAGSKITVAVVPYSGYTFDYLLVNGAKVFSKTFTMPSANTTVKAVFKKTVAAKPSLKPKATRISSLKNKKGKRAVLTWKKVSGISGYQIMYAKNAGFTKSKKVVKVGANTTSKTFKKLAKKKTYYFKIRTYKGSSYSSWSKAKHIKIKK